MTKDEKIAKLGKVITDRATVLLGKDKITPDSPEYLGINSALKFTAVKYDEKMADDILDIALTMKKRVPLTIEQLAKKNPQFDRAYLEKAMQAISESGLVEFHWENLDGKNPNHEKRWVLDMFVPGSAEIMMINPEQSDMFRRRPISLNAWPICRWRVLLKWCRPEAPESACTSSRSKRRSRPRASLCRSSTCPTG